MQQLQKKSSCTADYRTGKDRQDGPKTRHVTQTKHITHDTHGWDEWTAQKKHRVSQESSGDDPAAPALTLGGGKHVRSIVTTSQHRWTEAGVGFLVSCFIVCTYSSARRSGISKPVVIAAAENETKTEHTKQKEKSHLGFSSVKTQVGNSRLE